MTIKRLAALALFLLSAFALPACSQSMKKPDIKHNPNPKMRYEIALAIQDAPGPFESVTAFAYYETDDRCVPEQPVSGARLTVRTDVPIALQKSGANAYQGTVYLDLMQDEDYYGLGVCRWRLVSFNVAMKAGEVTFGPAISGKEIASLKPRTQYFAKSYFGDPSVIKNTHVAGSPLDQFAPNIRNNVFSTTLTPKERFQ